MIPVEFVLAYKVTLDIISILLGSIAAGLMLRASVVYTSIIAQFITIAIVYGYLSDLNGLLALTVAYLSSLLVVSGSIAISLVNRRSYIFALYAISLASVPLSNFVLQIFAVDGKAVSTPATRWPLNDAWTLAIGALAAVAGLLLLWRFPKTWRGVLLQHWSSVPARSARDMQISGAFRVRRIVSASWPTAIAASLFFLVAVLVGCFAQNDAYTASYYAAVPFLALLFALMTKGSPIPLFAVVILYGLARFAFEYLVNELNLNFPVRATYIVFGLLFFLFVGLVSLRNARARA